MNNRQLDPIHPFYCAHAQRVPAHYQRMNTLHSALSDYNTAEMSNHTVSDLPPLPAYTLQPLPALVPGIPDKYLTLILPIVAYWAVSLVFHCVDELDLFPHYRLHTPAEVLKRNHVSRWEVFRDVVIQQVVQTLFGVVLGMIEPDAMVGKEDYDIAVWAQRLRTAQTHIPSALALIGVDALGIAKNVAGSHAMLAAALSGGRYAGLTQNIQLTGTLATATVPAFAQWELMTAKAIYHVGVPTLQFLLGVLVVDTWQYFLHRAMHMNKWLYTTFHSRHHRLYVPYAYGALYNHPFEGFLLDTLGTGLAYLISGMTPRQSMWFFTCSTIKTVDDHCGYAFPWDPLQKLTSNNAGYHDVHHQSWGIKTNFSQPFFTFWDGLLGTKWVGGDVSARYERARLAAEKKMQADMSPITASTAQESTKADPTPYTRDAQAATPAARPSQPQAPPGKAAKQAAASRQQILDDRDAGGMAVLREELVEERREQQQQQQQQQTALRRSPRKRTTSSSAKGLKGLTDRMSGSLHGRGTGVLGVESGRQ